MITAFEAAISTKGAAVGAQNRRRLRNRKIKFENANPALERAPVFLRERT
jgi:hypothetical protein